MAIFPQVYGMFTAVSLLPLLLSYIFTSLGFYTLAKRRGIPHPGLSWVFVGGLPWIIGSLADQYAYMTEGKTKGRRKLLPWMQIGVLVFNLICMGAVFVLILASFGPSPAYDSRPLFPFIIAVSAMLLVLAGGIVVYLVFFYKALHQVYKSCDPQNATLYLVLSIVFTPFFIFFNRNKDGGFPPAPPEPQGTDPGPDPGI